MALVCNQEVPGYTLLLLAGIFLSSREFNFSAGHINSSLTPNSCDVYKHILFLLYEAWL